MSGEGGELFTECLLGAGCWRYFLQQDDPTFWEMGSLQLSFDGHGRVKIINLLPTRPLSLEVFVGGKCTNSVLKDVLWKIPNPWTLKIRMFAAMSHLTEYLQLLCLGNLDLSGPQFSFL